MSRYPNETVERFDQQFAETPEERQERQAKRRALNNRSQTTPPLENLNQVADRALLEAATIALVAEFIGEITGLRPPLERELFPPEWRSALNRLIDGLQQLRKESN
jgi:hypothetical protein